MLRPTTLIPIQASKILTTTKSTVFKYNGLESLVVMVSTYGDNRFSPQVFLSLEFSIHLSCLRFHKEEPQC